MEVGACLRQLSHCIHAQAKKCMPVPTPRCGHLSLLPPLKSWKPRATLSFWAVLTWIVTLLCHISPMLYTTSQASCLHTAQPFPWAEVPASQESLTEHTSPEIPTLMSGALFSVTLRSHTQLHLIFSLRLRLPSTARV